MTKRERELKEKLDALYLQWNQKAYVSPDPLETLYAYTDPLEREVVGMVASGLAYGRVSQILLSIEKILSMMGPSPRSWLLDQSPEEIDSACKGFVYRFTRGEHMHALFLGMRQAILTHGSLKACFLHGISPEHETLLPALSLFVKEIKRKGELPGHLLADPEGKSACKKANLFLRWMVRRDDVDPGGWDDVLSASKLIVPLDTHMHKIALALKLTSRKAADLATAREVTRSLARFAPDDPVRYDFCLTRFGIRGELDIRDITG